MRVIQVPFCFYPDSVGGTEVYVEALSRNLQQQGVEVLIAAPGEVNQSYLYNQLRVRRYAISNQVENLREMYGEGDRQAALEFSRILETEQPDLVHFHAFTSGVSLRLVQAAKQRQIPVVFTYHTPTVSCLRGTLMQWGTEICNGKVDLKTCSQCTLQGLGLDKTSAGAIANLPPQLGHWLGNLNLQGGAWTALRMTELVNLRHKALHTLLSEVDHIVAVCNWVKDVLLLNHVPSEKITVIRQGLCHNLPEKTNSSQQYAQPTLNIAFLGRLDPTKGIHILIKALKAVPKLPISLDIYGISQASDAYIRELQALAAKDPRITFKPPVPTEKVMATLTDYDLLAVPSQWLETGPMVVLEAFAAGVPVIGSNLGGIAELVEHEVNGILVEPTSVRDWSQALQRCQDRYLLRRLSAGIKPPSTMETVATHIRLIYHATIAQFL
ncbi:glycosyl transferase group 1 [Nostoc sp. 'Peltigera membranacea cyanobiont' 213]|uniref:glycosyltransferase family 4 protein n=1 Tax=Nostoc sp. 'Peltigera membranacea cyanobiont' 213 TaxID=2014530 RepID=UPI000B953317|nr:glycosyltransferase family 4 protein [Nostoc sp. 'Peltigera membranacea cyanobiont' 213]OYD99139.1 glycosyl transferase group 1 [Nostoc sp. 'Peltigera membranacea cyanobiont' 213]